MLSRSTTGILGMIFAIQGGEGGEGWAKRAVDEEGRPLFTPAEQEVWTATCEPYLPFFRSWVSHGQSGGQMEPGVRSPMETTDVAHVANTTTNTTNDVIGPDDLFEKAFHQYEKANSTIHQYVSKHGPIQMSTFDKGEDIAIFPKAMTTALQGYPATKAVGMALEKVKLPPRTLYVIVYLLLDMARTTSAVMGADQNRKLLSVVMAVLDLLRGDWKKAVLSLLGYAGSSQMYMGQLLKIYLIFFQMIHPRIQRDIIFGTYSLGKSLLIGGLLSVFQVTAPASVRLPVIETLEKLAERKQAIDDVLIEQGLAPRSDDLEVSFEHIERLQALMDDTAFICSTEYETLIKSVEKSYPLRMVFQLVGIPTSDTFKEQRCGKGPRAPLAEKIVQESLNHPERKPEESTPVEEETVTPTVQATNEQVEEAIQKVNQENSSEPTQEAPQKEEVPLPPTVNTQEAPQKQELSTPSNTLPPTIRPRGGRSLRRGH
jgi:hypothetical protein